MEEQRRAEECSQRFKGISTFFPTGTSSTLDVRLDYGHSDIFGTLTPSQVLSFGCCASYCKTESILSNSEATFDKVCLVNRMKTRPIIWCEQCTIYIYMFWYGNTKIQGKIRQGEKAGRCAWKESRDFQTYSTSGNACVSFSARKIQAKKMPINRH